MYALIYYVVTTALAVVLGIALVLTIRPGNANIKQAMGEGTIAVRRPETLDSLLDLMRCVHVCGRVRACVCFSFQPVLSLSDFKVTCMHGKYFFCTILTLIVSSVACKVRSRSRSFRKCNKTKMTDFIGQVWKQILGPRNLSNSIGLHVESTFWIGEKQSFFQSVGLMFAIFYCWNRVSIVQNGHLNWAESRWRGKESKRKIKLEDYSINYDHCFTGWMWRTCTYAQSGDLKLRGKCLLFRKIYTHDFDITRFLVHNIRQYDSRSITWRSRYDIVFPKFMANIFTNSFIHDFRLQMFYYQNVLTRKDSNEKAFEDGMVNKCDFVCFLHYSTTTNAEKLFISTSSLEWSSISSE